MKTYQIKVLADTDLEMITSLLDNLVQKGLIEFSETNPAEEQEAEEPSEDQVQEIIEEAELGPYYTEDESKKILNL